MTEYGRHDEQYHRDEQQRTPAVFITQWPEKNLVPMPAPIILVVSPNCTIDEWVKK